jgi:hypothetical protein
MTCGIQRQTAGEASKRNEDKQLVMYKGGVRKGLGKTCARDNTRRKWPSLKESRSALVGARTHVDMCKCEKK